MKLTLLSKFDDFKMALISSEGGLFLMITKLVSVNPWSAWKHSDKNVLMASDGASPNKRMCMELDLPLFE